MAMDGLGYAESVKALRPEAIRNRLALYRSHKITYIRDGGDFLGATLYAKEISEEFGIDYRTPAFAIHKTGLYGSIVGKAYTSLKEFASLVSEARNSGCDFIKLMASGLLDFNTFGKITHDRLYLDELQEMSHVVHDQGLSLMVHVNGTDAVRDCLLAGVDSIEHGYYLSKEIIRLIRDTDTLWVPTLAPIANLIGVNLYPDHTLREILSSQISNAAYAASIGVKLAIGSDAGAVNVYHVKGYFDEYDLLHSSETIDPEKLAISLRLGTLCLKEKFKRP
jgi:imidazolonepropionase-like amidohydrolase